MDPNTPNDAPEPVEVPTPESDAPQVPEVAELKKRMAGWQRTAQQHKADADAVKAKLTDAETEIANLRQQVNNFELTSQESTQAQEALQTQLTELQAAEAAQQAALDQLNTLMDFPELMSMRKLLRQDLGGDDYRQYLEEFSKTVAAMQTAKETRSLEGSTPPSGGEKSTGGLTVDEIYNRLMSGDPKSSEETAQLYQLLSTTLVGPDGRRQNSEP